MRQKHIAFFLAQEYGHVIPTLGIAMELLRRGYRVSYAVPKKFDLALARIGVQPVVFDPLEIRLPLLQCAEKEDGTYEFNSNPQLEALAIQLTKRKTADSLEKLGKLYSDDRPDLIVHDAAADTAGRDLGLKWGIPCVRHWPMLIAKEFVSAFEADELILVTLPRFLIDDSEFAMLDDRFHLVGFVPEGRVEFFDPWTPEPFSDPTIVISSTTSMLPQFDFCKLIVQAFGGGHWRVVLSAGGKHDPISQVGTDSFKELPSNFRLNQSSSTLEILKSASLFVGQGQQGGVLEALYCGVPTLTIPAPGPDYYDTLARRVQDLGLGVRVAPSSDGVEIRQAANFAMNDPGIRQRVRSAQDRMREDNAAIRAADLIQGRFRESVAPA